MSRRPARRCWRLAVALALAGAAPGLQAQTEAPAAAASAPPRATLPTVQINAGRPGEAEERRASTAAKIVIGREEIEQYGDSSLGDVLRRLPGVTQGGRPGRGGELRMRGMGGGYTQILVDGQRAPPGFAIDQLAPEMVERIELLRAPTAETGTRAIAGTINIVLREPLRTLGNELRAGLGEERGRLSPQLTWTRNAAFGERGSYNLTVNAGRTAQRTDTRTHTTHVDEGAAAPVLDQDGSEVSISRRDTLSLASRVQWRLGAGEQFSLQPFLMHRESSARSRGSLAARGATAPAPYATRSGASDADSDAARLTAQLLKRLDADTRADLRLSAGAFTAASASAQEQFDASGMPVLRQDSDTAIRDRSWSLNTKLMRSLGAGHSLVGGWELEAVRRLETIVTLVNDAPQPGDFGADVQARTRRTALYLQDEWEPAPDWSAYVGLRAETIRTTSASPALRADRQTRVVSPLAHVVWRYAAPRRDQLRLSLTHSYRAPPLQSLIGLPRLNTLYPVPGGNVAASPDSAGNPALRPETARGIDLALERYLDAGGIVSMNLHYRRIANLIRNVTTLEQVAWAPVPRWVSRPQNLGDATSRGIEFDAKFRLTEWRASAPPVNLRLNLSLYDSAVETVPGPDNRINQQPRATGNIGADYRLRGTAWTLGGTLGLTPAYRTRLTELQHQALGTRRVADAYLLWQIDPSTRLRLALANIAPRDSVDAASVQQDGQFQTVRTTGRTELATSLRLEIKL